MSPYTYYPEKIRRALLSLPKEVRRQMTRQEWWDLPYLAFWGYSVNSLKIRTGAPVEACRLAHEIAKACREEYQTHCNQDAVEEFNVGEFVEVV